ncbi:MAG: biotin--[Oscillospiraceae bacterium]|nr:biotin--[acetyl-CoA-carboxylase] ligase [Oscillospiraceae bacterium]
MTTKDKILNELIKSKNDYISGGRIGRNLGISRNAVWKAIKQLENEGFKIEAVTNKGYRLLQKADTITAEDIINSMNTENVKENIIILDTTDSTNVYAKKLAEEGAKDRTVVIANEQSAGKGRMGRTFCSPKNSGIYMSLILRPDFPIDAAQLLTSYTAVTASQAIDNLYECSTQIKRVNDIMLCDKKICGILTEASINCETCRFSYIIVGIGINVGSVKNSFEDDLLSIASSLEDETKIVLPRSLVIAEFLDIFFENLPSLYDRSFLSLYRERSWILGKDVSVLRNGVATDAIALSIDDNAGLTVQYTDGTTETINSGEASVKKQTK